MAYAARKGKERLGEGLLMGLYPFDPSRFGRLGVDAGLAGRKPLPPPDTDDWQAWEIWEAWTAGYQRAVKFLNDERLPERALTVEAAAVRAAGRSGADVG